MTATSTSMITAAPRTTLVMITPTLVRPTRCSRFARASARLSCSRSALLSLGGGPGGGGTRGRGRNTRPLNGRHFGPPNDQFHDKLSRLYGSLGSSIGTSWVNACLAPSMKPACRRVGGGSDDASHVDDRDSAEAQVARINYDDQTAAAYKAVREVPRDGLGAWRQAVRRHLRSSQRMSVVDIGAGTGTFAAAFRDWFDFAILAVEPSAAMRAQIPSRPGIQVFDGHANALPLADHSADGAWLSLVLHHIPDLEAAAREIRRVLRPGAPVLIRQGFSGRLDTARTFPWEFFRETARTVNTYPTIDQTCQAFATAGFSRDALEQVPETLISLAEFLDRADGFRRADTNMRGLTEDEFLRGKEELRIAVQHAEHAARMEPRTNWLDLLVLR